MNEGSEHLAHASLFGTGNLIRQSRCAVIVAHPNDEVIGAGGLISRLKDVTILHVTNGSPQREQAQAAGEECASALALANVPKHRIVKLGVLNQQAPHSLVPLTKRIATFLRQSEAHVVLTHPYEGGHPDHDATAFATHAAMALLKRHGFKPPVLFEIALRPSDDGKSRVLDFLPGQWRESTTLILNKEARDLKSRMLNCLTIQEGVPRDRPLGTEKFRRPPDYNFALAPGAGKPNYESFDTRLTGADWAVLATKALAELFPVEGASSSTTSPWKGPRESSRDTR